VAQRRRRVFVVGHFGDWQRAAQVLFERESVQRNPAPSREARQGAAAGVGGGPDGGRIAGAVTRKWSKGSGGPAGDECYNMVAQQVKCATGDITHALTTRSAATEDGTGRGTPLVPVAFHPTQDPISSEDGTTHAMGCGSKGGAATVAVAQLVPDVAPTLDQRAGRSGENSFATSGGLVPVAQPVATVTDMRGLGDGHVAPTLRAKETANDFTPIVMQPVGTDCYNGAITGDVAATLGTPGSSVNASGPTVMQPVAFPIDTQNMTEGHASGGLGFGQENDPSFTLTKGHSHAVAVAQPMATDIKQVQWASGGGQLENDTAQALRSNAEYNYQFARIAMQVRRLTPVECERLQGFPDNYTNIPWRKKPEAPDGPRYKALGNSMAVPGMAWIGKRIAEVDRGD